MGERGEGEGPWGGRRGRRRRERRYLRILAEASVSLNQGVPVYCGFCAWVVRSAA